MRKTQLQQEIIELKRKKNIVILSHYYQPIEIQEIADYLGDSLGLSKLAKEKVNSDYIIFAGVDFMAETASILNQNRHILIPNYESCCPMAAYLTADMVKEYKKKYPEIPVVVYVNSTAAVKAESDICCTSSNAVSIVKRISKDMGTDKVLFGPDAHLADYVEQKSGIETVKMPPEGNCYVHSQINKNDVENVRKNYPNSELLVHPECKREVRDLADYVGSTSQMYNYVKHNSSTKECFIIGTEIGLLERMKKDFPKNQFILVKEKLVCYNMKKHNLELIKYLLENPQDKNFEIKVPPNIAKKAYIPIQKMLDYS
ncbi:MAG: quinolinate synthase NadA [Candidatus Thorarchaeota archaeon]